MPMYTESHSRGCSVFLILRGQVEMLQRLYEAHASSEWISIHENHLPLGHANLENCQHYFTGGLETAMFCQQLFFCWSYSPCFIVNHNATSGMGQCNPQSLPSLRRLCACFLDRGSKLSIPIFPLQPVNLWPFFCHQLVRHYAREDTYGVGRYGEICPGHSKSTCPLHSYYL